MQDAEITEPPKDLPAKVADESTREKIIRMLISGEFPVDAQIARECNVEVSVVQDMLAKDPELKKLRAQAEQEMAQLIEQSAMNLAIRGRNEIARQKAQEFMLKNLMPDKYGDEAARRKSGGSQKRILLVKELPVVTVDENGIPVAHSKSPLDPELLEVK